MRSALLAAATGWLLVAGHAAGDEEEAKRPADKAPGELNDKTLPLWRDRIRPGTEERAYDTVKWLPTFWEAVIAAQKKDRPILLWAMNGHPLACT